MIEMEDIKATKNFSTQAHILANDFHLSNKDAKSLLLERIYHRLQSGKEFNDWVTTWSRKDCERSLGNEYRYNAEHIDDGYQMDDITNPSTDEQYSQLSDDVLTKIFPDSRSREFVQSILNYGKKETMAKFSLSKQQFNSRLNHRIKYIDQHSELISSILDTEERKSMEKEKTLIELLLDDVDNPLITDRDLNEMVKTFFSYYPMLSDWLDHASEQLGLRYEAKVVNDFTNSGKDGRLFLQYLYQLLDSINEQLERKQ